MGIHDIETINKLSEELKMIDPTLFIYGEGWTGGISPLPDSLRALKSNTLHLSDVAAFSDDIRDAIKGSVFDLKSKGFVSGASGMEESIKFGVVASTMHPQIDMAKVKYSEYPWSNKPSQTIGYVTCHDNNTLYDKLLVSCPESPAEEIKKMHKLANAIILTSQSIPFLHAGVEFMRTKEGEHNSFNLSDDINQVEWDWKTENHDIFEYYKGLITLRRKHPALRMPTAEMIVKHLTFYDISKSGIVGFQITDNANGDEWKNIVIIYNANKTYYEFTLPPGKWQVAIKDSWIVEEGLEESHGTVAVPPLSMLVLFQK
jgi:pullulanase